MPVIKFICKAPLTAPSTPLPRGGEFFGLMKSLNWLGNPFKGWGQIQIKTKIKKKPKKRKNKN